MGYIGNHIIWEHKYGVTHLQNGEIWVGSISAPAAEAILHDHAAVLVECYIDHDHLEELARENNQMPGQLLQNEILPDAPHIRSGDFGEILARSALQEKGDCPRFPAFRWRNRAHKNDTVRGPDLLGYVICQGDEPSENDVLVICEVKTRAATVNEEVVKEAFEDTRKHYISRLANSLYFIQIWLKRQGQEDEAKRFARFTNPHKLPFVKRLVPSVVHESQTWDDGFLRELPEVHDLRDPIEVTVICVENLSGWMDSIHREAVACAGVQ